MTTKHKDNDQPSATLSESREPFSDAMRQQESNRSPNDKRRESLLNAIGTFYKNQKGKR